MKANLCLFVILAVLFTLFSSPGFTKEPEEIWEELSKLSGEKRQNFLLSKAKAEGEVLWYSNLPIQVLSSIRKGFNKRFPGVKAGIWRASGRELQTVS